MASLRQLRSGDPSRSLNDFYTWMQSVGGQFPTGFPSVSTYGSEGQQRIAPDATIESFRNIYRTNGVVFAVSAVRQRIFSEVTFRFMSLSDGRNGKLFGTQDLRVLEKPWPNGTTGELASRMIHDVDTAGNFYAVRPRDDAGNFIGGRLYWRDPKKMAIILSGDPLVDEFVDIVGYTYSPSASGDRFFYTVDEVCHWAPTPDPDSPYRGMSWISPVLREIHADNSATDHKANSFANAATPNMVVKFPESVMNQDQFDRFKAKMEADYAGSRGAGKTLYLAPGADATVVGQSFADLDFGNTQGRDETRIASAGGVPPVIAGLKESLAGSSLNQGNFAAARRQLADGTMRPLFRSASASLETICPAPVSSRGAAKLWFDDGGIAFFREDQADAANISLTSAQTMAADIAAGWTPESVLAAYAADDRTLLKHSGLVSVQLQPPGTQGPNPSAQTSDAQPTTPAQSPGGSA